MVEVNLLTDSAVHRHLRDSPARAEAHDVAELPSGQERLASAGAGVFHPDLRETAPFDVHAHARCEAGIQKSAVPVDLAACADERPDPASESAGAKRPAHVARQSADPDLRHESGVGAEAVTDVTALGRRVE